MLSELFDWLRLPTNHVFFYKPTNPCLVNCEDLLACRQCQIVSMDKLYVYCSWKPADNHECRLYSDVDANKSMDDHTIGRTNTSQTESNRVRWLLRPAEGGCMHAHVCGLYNCRTAPWCMCITVPRMTNIILCGHRIWSDASWLDYLVYTHF